MKHFLRPLPLVAGRLPGKYFLILRARDKQNRFPFGMLHIKLGLCHSTGIFVLVRYLGFKVVSVVQNWPLSYSPILCHFFIFVVDSRSEPGEETE